MNIHIYKDGQQFGPFPEAEIRAQLSNGNINETDLAWVDGNKDWAILQIDRPPEMPIHPVVQSTPPVIQVVSSQPLSHNGVSYAAWTLLSLCCIASLILVWDLVYG